MTSEPPSSPSFSTRRCVEPHSQVHAQTNHRRHHGRPCRGRSRNLPPTARQRSRVRSRHARCVWRCAAAFPLCARQTNIPAPKRIISEIEWADKCSAIDGPAVLDLFGFDAEEFTPGTVSARTGAAGYRLRRSRASRRRWPEQVAAVATAPLNKEALRMPPAFHVSRPHGDVRRQDGRRRGPA
jgi:hypothetical protein